MYISCSCITCRQYNHNCFQCIDDKSVLCLQPWGCWRHTKSFRISKTYLRHSDLRREQFPNSTLVCVTVLNSNTIDNEAQHFIAGRIPQPGCRQKQQQQHPIHFSSPPPPPRSALSSAWVIRTLWCLSKNLWEDLYSRWGLGCCFLNIYEPLDRGSCVLDCRPRCPLAEKASSSGLKSTLGLTPAIWLSGNRGFKRPLDRNSQELQPL